MRVLRDAREVPALWVLTACDLDYCEQHVHHSSEILFHPEICTTAVRIAGFAGLYKVGVKAEGRHLSGV